MDDTVDLYIDSDNSNRTRHTKVYCDCARISIVSRLILTGAQNVWNTRCREE
jgi:hypothetical protein